MAAARSRIGGWLSVGAELSQGTASPPGYGRQPGSLLGAPGGFAVQCHAATSRRAAARNWCGKGKHYQTGRPGEGNWMYLLGSSVQRELRMGRVGLDGSGDVQRSLGVGTGQLLLA